LQIEQTDVNSIAEVDLLDSVCNAVLIDSTHSGSAKCNKDKSTHWLNGH
jgi:hypothetical protein